MRSLTTVFAVLAAAAAAEPSIERIYITEVATAQGLQPPAQSQVEPATWVDDDGADCPAGATCHRTISAGLSAAAAGDVVGVLPGTYAPFKISSDNVKIVAMRDAATEVNADADPYNADWPVKIVGSGYDGSDTCVRVAGGRDDVLVRGFEVRDCFRGMHASMSGTAANFVDPGERITFAGNHIYCMSEDGIKFNQVSDVWAIGNWIEYVSWPEGDCNGDGVKDGIPHGYEHAIDCVACANWHYIGNRYGHTTYLMAKGGSISGEVRGNICEGPVTLKCLVVETVGHKKWTFWSSDQGQKYESKGLSVVDNDFAACASTSCGGSGNDVQIKHGMDVSFRGNRYAKSDGNGNIAFSDGAQGSTANSCVETGVATAHPAVTFSDTCPTDWPAARRRDGTPKGFDFFY